MWVVRIRELPVIGRLVYVQPAAGELFYMRLLLNIVHEATSFEDLRTVNGIQYNSYEEACLAHNILGNDEEWHNSTKRGIFTSNRTIIEAFVYNNAFILVKSLMCGHYGTKLGY